MPSDPSPLVLGKADRRVELSGFVLTETFRPPGLVLPPHFHEHANIALTLEGTFVETIAEHAQELSPFGVVLRPAGEKHSDWYGRTAARCLIIEVRPQRLAMIREVTRILDQAAFVRVGLISHLALRIYQEFRMSDAVAPLAIEALIFEMLVQVTRNDDVVPGSQPRWLRQAKELVHEQFYRPLSLSDVAESVGVHPAHLAKMYRKHYGCTVGDDVRKLRLNHAAELLAGSDQPLAAIALAAGFYDQSHFTHMFKLSFGVTPAEFQNDVKKSRASS
jgi:AraC family transcriptional regulator